MSRISRLGGLDKTIADNVDKLAADFADCSKVLTAIGDETRQHIILEMLKMEKCSGARVGEITEKTNLSRPAVSHHIQIMKDAGIIKCRQEGTKNYYYFDPDMKMLKQVDEALKLIIMITKLLPDRSGENE
jgi:ArsR family transcriptional regulator, arsenate/arsenite/antimonite-responsive transcriptional repressor